LAGPNIFTTEMMNLVLNKFVQNLQTMTFDQVLTFFEILIACCRQQTSSN
jgi:hypothetical protein